MSEKCQCQRGCDPEYVSVDHGSTQGQQQTDTRQRAGCTKKAEEKSFTRPLSIHYDRCFSQQVGDDQIDDDGGLSWFNLHLGASTAAERCIQLHDGVIQIRRKCYPGKVRYEQPAGSTAAATANNDQRDN